MKRNVILVIASMLSIILLTFHLTDDIVRGMEPGTLIDLIPAPILAVWLYGTLVVPQRPSGHVIVLLGSLVGLVVAIVHMKGAGVGAIAKSPGGFFFVWTIYGLSVSSFLSAMLAARALWERWRGRPA